MKRLGLWAAALGAIAIGYEVVWFRVLSAFFDATTYAFTLLLSIFLVGLALGGALSVRLLRKAGGDARAWLADVQAGLAWTALLAFVALGLSRGLAQGLRSVVGEGILWMAIHASVVMLVPATLVGMSFPLLIHLATRADRAGADVGRIYALNTIGGIASSLLFGFALIPLLGTQRANGLLCLLSAGVALALHAKKRIHAVSVAALAVCLLMVPKDFFVLAQVGWPDATLLEAREGRDGILAAMEYTRASVCGSKLYACPADCPDFAHRRLAFGSISYASTTMPARRYMRMEGHLPMMFAAEPKRALQVCFGTGTTAGALAAWPSLEKATIVDLNPDVIDFAKHFESVNKGVLADPRFEVVIDDGRHFLLTTTQMFDAVSFEPPPPRAQGVVNLYSQEFYALVKAHLTEGGVVAQWLPMDQQSQRLNRELVAAVLAEFPHAALYVPSRFHGVLLASRKPLTPRNWDALFAVPALKASFEDVGFFGPDDVQATFVAGNEGLLRFVGDAPPVTDDRPSIEHFLGSLDEPVTAAALQSLSPTAAGPKTAAQWKLVLSTQRQNEGDYAAAQKLVEEAEALAGKTPWTAYLREVTYGCLAPRSAHTRAD